MSVQTLASINENGFMNADGTPDKYHGFEDWFCTEASLINRSAKLLKVANRIADTLGLNKDFINVSFKNCLSCYHGGYDLIWLSNSSGKAFMAIVPKCPYKNGFVVDVNSENTSCEKIFKMPKNELTFKNSREFIKYLKNI